MPTRATGKAAGPRLEPDARRAHLLAVGASAFAAHPYDEVQIDRIAQLAGVSRGLLYHYFPTKRQFFSAIIQQGYKGILDATRPDPDVPAEQQLRVALEAYLDYVEAHPHLYRAIFRSGASADRNIRKVINRNLDRQARRILDAYEQTHPANPAVDVAVRSWLAFLIQSVLDWLDETAAISREQLLELCVGTLQGAILAAERTGEPGR